MKMKENDGRNVVVGHARPHPSPKRPTRLILNVEKKDPAEIALFSRPKQLILKLLYLKLCSFFLPSSCGHQPEKAAAAIKNEWQAS